MGDDMILNEKPKRKRRKKKPYFPVGLRLWLWVVACFVGTLICIASTCFGILTLTWGNSYSACFGTPFPAYEDVESGSLFKFPPSAQNIEYDANSANRKGGCTAWIKFEIDLDDLDVLLESTLVGSLTHIRLDTEEGGITYFMKRKGWSQPIESLAGHGHTTDYIYPPVDQWIYVDTSSPDSYIVYIITNAEWI